MGLRSAFSLRLIASVCVAGLFASAPAADTFGPIVVKAVQVPLNPQDPSATTIGDFVYGGGLMLSSTQTDQLHELSDIVLTGTDRMTAVGDGGVLVEARLVLDDRNRLVGITNARISPLIGHDGKPLTRRSAGDAEGLALLPNGDRLVSFEKRHRILLYPASGGLPRLAPWPGVRFPSNMGMEALTADPEAGNDAYVVGAEGSGETWTCKLSAGCVKGPTVKKPPEFGLVAVNRLPEGRTAYLLRAYDGVRGSRITLEIMQSAAVVARLDLARPMTVDNFEGVTSGPGVNGARRFYLVSDDNASAAQATLLMAFDWQPR